MTSNPTGTLLSVLKGLANALLPLTDQLDPPDKALAFMAELGVNLPSPPQSLRDLGTELTQLKSAYDAIMAFLDGGGDQGSAEGFGRLADLAKASTGIAQAMLSLPAKLQAEFAAYPALLSAVDFSVLGRRLLDYLLVNYARTNFPAIFNALLIPGIFEDQFVEGDEQFIPPNVNTTVHYDRVAKLFSAPAQLAAEVYGWGTPILDSQAVLERIDYLLNSLGAPCGFYKANAVVERVVNGTATPGESPTPELRVTLFSDTGSVGQIEAGIGALAVPATAAGSDAGFMARPYVIGSGSVEFDLTENLALAISGGLDLTAGAAVILRPPSVISLLTGFFSQGVPGSGATLKLVLSLQHSDGTRVFIAGQPGLSYFDAAGLDFGVSVSLSGGANFDVAIGIDLRDGALQIGTSQGDGFLQAVLPKDGLKIKLDLGLLWSSKRGLAFKGGGGFETTVPVHASILGILTVDTIYLSFQFENGQVNGKIAGDVGLALGPIQAAVQKLGMSSTLSFPSGGGNLGIADLQVGFKFPDGLGLSIDAGAVSGGGFVSFDQNKGEYAGFLDISIVDIIQVKFICILDTKLPDGSKGFSLLFIIFMELPPIQLGFGFTLNGVGGIAGVHRTMSPPGLQTGIHNHTLDYIINPPHTIADAPKAITAINSFFPAAQGRYLFGPILELGWETFIEVTVGVILEVPDPIKLAIIGILDIALPTIEEPEVALVKIHIDVLGIVDFGAMKLSIDGSMYDSSLLEFPLLGDFALRSSWGTNPSSAFSLGGFNPNFNATGLDMPQLHRLSITISDGDNPVISANAYLALTSNTRQFGANIEASVRAGSFSVHGYLGFDLLVTVQRHAISFEFDFAAILDVSYKGHSLAGINVTGQLTGPTPWHIHGDASFHILCFSVSKSVDHTWGQNILATIVTMAILPDLLPPFLDPQNWNAALPDGATQAVTLSAPTANKGVIIVHPLGALTVREKVVPLDLTIDQYKSGTPADGNYFSMGDVLINGSKVSKGEHHQDYFAAGEFLNLTDADKLSRSSFELYHAGLHISSDNVASGASASRTVEYQELYVEDPVLPPRPPVTYTMPADVFEVLSHQSAGFSSRLKNTGLGKYKAGPSTPAATTGDPAYVVASADDLSVRTDIIGAGGTSYYQARDALNTHLAKNPQDAGKLQILPAHEVAP